MPTKETPAHPSPSSWGPEDSAKFFAGMLDALSAHICVLNEQGLIVAANRAWREFAQANQLKHPAAGVGLNYLTACDTAVGSTSDTAAAFAAGIRSVLSGKAKEFHLEYACHSPSAKRWFVGHVTPFAGAGVLGVLVAHENITELKQAGEALRQSEARLQLALEAAQAGSWEFDPLTQHCVWSDSLYRLYGLEPGSIDPTYDAWLNLVLEQDRARVDEQVRKTLKQVSDWSLEWRAPDRQGQVRWFMARGRPVLGTAGAPVRHIGIALDITERKQTEILLKAHADLAEAAQRLSLDELVQIALDKAEALTGSGIGFFHFVDADQQNLSLQTWSTNTLKNMCTAAGKGQHYPVSKAGVWTDCLRTGAPVIHNDYASLPHRKGLPEGHAPVVRELVVPVMRGGIAVALLGVGNKSADYLPNDVVLVTKIADIVADYALRKRAEEALRSSEASLSAAQRLAHIGSWQWDLQTNKMDWSEETCRIFGMAPEELSDPKVDFVTCLHPADRPRAEQAIKEALAGARDYNLEYRVTCADGSHKIIHAQAEVLRSASGQPMLVRGTFQDITGRKALEEQLRQAQKLESIGQLAGGVAHDFNNILAATLMNLGFLKDNRGLDADAGAIVRELEAEAKRAANLTRQLLMFSRRSMLEIRRVDLNEVIENLLKMLRRLMGENLSLQFERSAELLPVDADPGMLEQVLVNLCVNARDAMLKEGTITITTRYAALNPHRPAASASPSLRPHVCFSVADTGCGMDPATLEHLFEPFFTTKPQGKGTGLGLATVHGIIAQHHGWVEVDSQPGKGTTFTVFLPAAAPIGGNAPTSLESEALGGTERILLVEDDPSLRLATAKGLTRLGYVVVTAANGPDALHLWQEYQGKFDLLLTDLVMPGGFSGLDLIQQLRVLNPSLKVVICSGYSEEMFGQNLMPSPTPYRLQKPYQTSDLTRMLRKCLANE